MKYRLSTVSFQQGVSLSTLSYQHIYILSTLSYQQRYRLSTISLLHTDIYLQYRITREI